MTKSNKDLKKRIEWDHIFLLEAILWSKRSHDTQTQCGCVLVRDKTVLSTGYNGFIGEINDSVLPNVRPAKYDFMIHAEHNAILNCARMGVSTKNSTAYITGKPCNDCLQYMWQAGIANIIYTNYSDINMIQNKQFDNVRYQLSKVMGTSLYFIPVEKLKENSVLLK